MSITLRPSVTAPFFRSTRVQRLTTAGIILGQLVISAPLLAQDLSQATVNASARAAADLQRAVAKQRVKVNRTVPTVTPPNIDPMFGVDVTTAT